MKKYMIKIVDKNKIKIRKTRSSRKIVDTSAPVIRRASSAILFHIFLLALLARKHKKNARQPPHSLPTPASNFTVHSLD